MDRHAVPAHSFSVPARSFGSGRAPGPLRTKPLRVLLHVHCDVFARHRANGSSRRTFSASVVRAVRRTKCATGRRRSLCAPTRLRSIFSWYQLVTLLAWALVFRRLLVGNAMP